MAWSAFLRGLVVYVTATFVMLQLLDVLAEPLGLPPRTFLWVIIGAATLLPAALAVAALKGLSVEERGPARATERGPARPSARIKPKPTEALPTRERSPADLARLHYELGRRHEAAGDAATAAHHYEKFLELSEQ
jgi:hypothetical protein